MISCALKNIRDKEEKDSVDEKLMDIHLEMLS